MHAMEKVRSVIAGSWPGQSMQRRWTTVPAGQGLSSSATVPQGLVAAPVGRPEPSPRPRSEMHSSLTRLPENLPDALRHLDVLSVLGFGAYAQVLEVRDGVNKRFALKVVEKQPLEVRDMRAQLEQELAANACLRHPRMLSAVEILEDDIHVFMVLPLCRGGSVREATRRFPDFLVPEWVATRWLHDAIEAVAYLHSLGLVHRDVKLENLLLDEASRTKLCDFGWCTFESDGASGICGTPQLCPPEAHAGHPHTCKMDAWLLGACFTQLLRGRPLSGPEDTEPPLGLSPGALELLQGLLQRDPELRWTAEEALEVPLMLSALEQLAEEENTSMDEDDGGQGLGNTAQCLVNLTTLSAGVDDVVARLDVVAAVDTPTRKARTLSTHLLSSSLSRQESPSPARLDVVAAVDTPTRKARTLSTHLLSSSLSRQESPSPARSPSPGQPSSPRKRSCDAGAADAAECQAGRLMDSPERNDDPPRIPGPTCTPVEDRCREILEDLYVESYSDDVKSRPAAERAWIRPEKDHHRQQLSKPMQGVVSGGEMTTISEAAREESGDEDTDAAPPVMQTSARLHVHDVSSPMVLEEATEGDVGTVTNAIPLVEEQPVRRAGSGAVPSAEVLTAAAVAAATRARPMPVPPVSASPGSPRKSHKPTLKEVAEQLDAAAAARGTTRSSGDAPLRGMPAEGDVGGRAPVSRAEQVQVVAGEVASLVKSLRAGLVEQNASGSAATKVELSATMLPGTIPLGQVAASPQLSHQGSSLPTQLPTPLLTHRSHQAGGHSASSRTGGISSPSAPASRSGARHAYVMASGRPAAVGALTARSFSGASASRSPLSARHHGYAAAGAAHLLGAGRSVSSSALPSRDPLSAGTRGPRTISPGYQPRQASAGGSVSVAVRTVSSTMPTMLPPRRFVSAVGVATLASPAPRETQPAATPALQMSLSSPTLQARVTSSASAVAAAALSRHSSQERLIYLSQQPASKEAPAEVFVTPPEPAQPSRARSASPAVVAAAIPVHQSPRFYSAAMPVRPSRTPRPVPMPQARSTSPVVTRASSQEAARVRRSPSPPVLVAAGGSVALPIGRAHRMPAVSVISPTAWPAATSAPTPWPSSAAMSAPFLPQGAALVQQPAVAAYSWRLQPAGGSLQLPPAAPSASPSSSSLAFVAPAAAAARPFMGPAVGRSASPPLLMHRGEGGQRMVVQQPAPALRSPAAGAVPSSRSPVPARSVAVSSTPSRAMSPRHMGQGRVVTRDAVLQATPTPRLAVSAATPRLTPRPVTGMVVGAPARSSFAPRPAAGLLGTMSPREQLYATGNVQLSARNSYAELPKLIEVAGTPPQTARNRAPLIRDEAIDFN
eukprot:TRINITY_DN57077_c0_g1_i1.p1 TRINITY_DN57077_c0_g1~~TRINITY_DN57077_c0_g1_i1.p1  ORF type:complete len:1349 (-),score=230.28 TRINITY_DN57077_c0_g1_i1:274-4320(-)